MSTLKIEISNGFLGLHSARELEMRWVKGSSITMLARRGAVIGMANDEGKVEGSLVTIGDSGWSIEVMDSIGDIINAISESYKQARAR